MDVTDESVTAPGVQVCSAVQAEQAAPRRERNLNWSGLPSSKPSMRQRVSGSTFSDCHSASAADFQPIS
jgi:hypothetical protein